MAKRKSRFDWIPVAALLVVLPGNAYAHGEEALFFPVGVLFALPFIALLACLAVRGLIARMTVITLPIAIAAGVGFLPGRFFPDWFRYTGEGNFIAGLAPPLLVAVVVALAFRRCIA